MNTYMQMKSIRGFSSDVNVLLRQYFAIKSQTEQEGCTSCNSSVNYRKIRKFLENPSRQLLLSAGSTPQIGIKPTHFTENLLQPSKSLLILSFCHFLFFPLVINRMIFIGLETIPQARRHAVFQTSNSVVVCTPTSTLSAPQMV